MLNSRVEGCFYLRTKNKLNKDFQLDEVCFAMKFWIEDYNNKDISCTNNFQIVVVYTNGVGSMINMSVYKLNSSFNIFLYNRLSDPDYLCITLAK